MTKGRKITLWIAVILIAITALVVFLVYRRHRKPLTLMGAVTAQDTDSRKEVPIAGVEITATNGVADASVKTDSSGYFAIKLHPWIRRGEAITLKFRHPKYKPLDLQEAVSDKIYVAHLIRIAKPSENTSNRPATTVGNVRVRYSIKAMRTVNVGSAVKTFQVESVGNIPCKGRPPCSPDGRWKATIGSTVLDAGPGNEFRNVRVSCIAGPCPFTKIESEESSKDGQAITTYARNWSETATFLVEAEVIHNMLSQIDHQSYPVIFGTALNFILPADADAVSIEADIAGETIIFPLGPSLLLSWADCNAQLNKDQSKVYRCNLKSGYRFQ